MYNELKYYFQLLQYEQYYQLLIRIMNQLNSNIFQGIEEIGAMIKDLEDGEMKIPTHPIYFCIAFVKGE